VGISALFLRMPLRYQPGVTQLFVDVSTTYLRYGLYPKDISDVLLVGFSSTVILLACVPLLDALGSSGPRAGAIVLLVPLALFSVTGIAQAVQNWLGSNWQEIHRSELYFRPGALVEGIAQLWAGLSVREFLLGVYFEEFAKWSIVFTIALWLSTAQFAAWWHGRGRCERVSRDAQRSASGGPHRSSHSPSGRG
jgi:hypothetical protein